MRRAKEITLILLGGLFIASSMASFSCKRNRSPKQFWESAKRQILLLADHPENTSIVGFSKIDSVFGHDFITEKEKPAVSEMLMRHNMKMLEEEDESNGNIFEDASSLQREMAITSKLQPLLMHEDEGGEHIGWKLKVQYKTADKKGKEYQAERWFIFDKENQNILYSFEIPII